MIEGLMESFMILRYEFNFEHLNKFYDETNYFILKLNVFCYLKRIFKIKMRKNYYFFHFQSENY